MPLRRRTPRRERRSVGCAAAGAARFRSRTSLSPGFDHPYLGPPGAAEQDLLVAHVLDVLQRHGESMVTDGQVFRPDRQSGSSCRAAFPWNRPSTGNVRPKPVTAVAPSGCTVASKMLIAGEPMKSATNRDCGLVVDVVRGSRLRDPALVDHHDSCPPASSPRPGRGSRRCSSRRSGRGACASSIRMAVRSFASRFESGSSNRNTRGSRAIALAIATRCR